MLALGLGLGVPFGAAPRSVAAPFDPIDTAPAVWYKASAGLYQDSAGTTPAAANNDPVGLWEDQSGNAKHLSQTTTASKPTLKTGVFGALAAPLFTTDDFLKRTAGIAGVFGGTDAPLSALIVVKKTSSGGSHRAWSFGRAASGNGFIAFYNNATPTWRVARTDDAGVNKTATGPTVAPSSDLLIPSVFTFTSDGLVGTLRQNGVAIYTAQDLDVGASSYDELALGCLLGAAASQFWEGYIAEFLAVPREWSAGEVTNLEAYAAAAWGL